MVSVALPLEYKRLNIQRFLIVNKPHCPKTIVEEPAQQSKPQFLPLNNLLPLYFPI